MFNTTQWRKSFSYKKLNRSEPPQTFSLLVTTTSKNTSSHPGSQAESIQADTQEDSGKNSLQFSNNKNKKLKNKPPSCQ